mgnify:CR=1 FL=1
MYIPLFNKSNYSLLSSLLKIDDIVSYAKENNISEIAIADTNMYGTMEFINKYMISANATYVKVYLYGLAKCYEGEEDVSNATIAEALDILETESKTMVSPSRTLRASLSHFSRFIEVPVYVSLTITAAGYSALMLRSCRSMLCFAVLIRAYP